jgi:uncharacterized protein YfaS (alpha-2-macroglobulin family)
MRALIRTGCVSLLMLGVLCGTAFATTRTGNQNPDLVVTATIGPNHLDVGERAVWVFTVTNTTDHTVQVKFSALLDTPFSGGELFGVGTLDPGKSFHFQRSLHAKEGGRYTLRVRARDKNGASHAHALAVA